MNSRFVNRFLTVTVFRYRERWFGNVDPDQAGVLITGVRHVRHNALKIANELAQLQVMRVG